MNNASGENRDVLLDVTNTMRVTDYNTTASAEATNSTIDINPHGEMVKWRDEKMVKWQNVEINIIKW